MSDKISRQTFIKGMAAGVASIAAFGLLEVADKAGTSKASSSTLKIANEAAKASGKAFTPGTYTATAKGMGTVTMTATFNESSITDIQLDLSGETPDIGQAAGDELIRQALAAQSSDIDGVSGATITTNAVKTCLDDVIAQASGETSGTAAAASAEDDSDWLGEAPEITDSDCSETLDTDVLIIGLGLAGVAAARSAAEEGVKVVGIEKADGPQCRSGEYAVINGNVEARWGRDIYTEDDMNEMIDFHMMESGYKVRRSIFSKYIHNIGETFDWWIAANPDLYIADTTRADIPDEYADNYLIPIFNPLPEHYDWRKEAFPCYPTSVEFKPDQHVTVEKNMQAAVDTGNVDARYGHFAEKLIMEDGRCVGAYIRNSSDGSYIRVNASKGVILSTGDYSQNEAMVKHFCPDVISNGIQRMFTSMDVEGNMTNQGDGIKLGMWAGAGVQGDHAPMIHHMGGGADLSGVGVMGNAGFLNLDMNGKRFMNEDLPGQQIENQIEIQKDKKTWQIFDGNWENELPYMPAAHGGACYVEHYNSDEEGPRNNQTYRNYKSQYQIDAAVADGRCLKADTLEDLVAQMYPDDTNAQETALASIRRYNELAEAGNDEDFGKVSSRLFPLSTAPYYADQFEQALLLVICGGLKSDEESHTLDPDGNIIPGLYVAGNVQGDRFSHEYPITLKGVSHGMAMYYGYVAGKNAAKGV